MTQSILVTGGSGFTGGHLCRKLAAMGYSVRALVRHLPCPPLQYPGIEPVLGDLRDADSLARAVQGIETIYHIAALFRPENVTRQDFWAANVEGTRNLLDAAVQAGVQRFVHCSTVGVHGDIQTPPATEETPYGPGDDYQDSKTAGEQLVRTYQQAGKLPLVIFRPGGIYGPGDRRFLKLFRAIARRRFIMFGSGEVLYQLIYIDDLIEGIVQCGTQTPALGNIYILTGQQPVTLNVFVQEIAAVLQVPPPRLRLPVMPLYWAGWGCERLCKPLGINPPLYRRRVDFFRKTRSFKITKAQTELNFQPATELSRGLRLTADWYRSQGYL